MISCLDIRQVLDGHLIMGQYVSSLRVQTHSGTVVSVAHLRPHLFTGFHESFRSSCLPVTLAVGHVWPTITRPEGQYPAKPVSTAAAAQR